MNYKHRLNAISEKAKENLDFIWMPVTQVPTAEEATVIYNDDTENPIYKEFIAKPPKCYIKMSKAKLEQREKMNFKF